MSLVEKILWVEDQLGTVQGTLMSARRLKYDIHVAKSLKDAEQLLHANSFEKMIVDFQIPSEFGVFPEKGLGLVLVDKIRAGEFGGGNARAKILLLTAQSATLRSNKTNTALFNDLELFEKPGSYSRVLDWLRG